MIIAPEEKKSQGALIAFIDLLFLLVAFFTLLLFFIQQRKVASEQELQAVQESLARITGEEVDVREAVKQLEPVLERFMASEQRDAELRRQAEEQELRRKQRTTFRLNYTLLRDGRVAYNNRTYTLQAFKNEVVGPLRGKHWVAFRAYTNPDTPFGLVVKSRRFLLQGSNEFDTYWDNLTRTKTQSQTGNRTPSR